MSRNPRAPQVARPSSVKPAKQPISLEDWEAKTPLSDAELRNVNAVKEASEIIPLPVQFGEEQQVARSSRPGTPRLNKLLLPPSRPGTPGGRLATATATHALHPKQPFQTLQQFYDWFALLDRSVAHSQEAHFRAHVGSVQGHLDRCDLLIDRVEEIDGLVEGMIDGWKSVEDGGKSLKDASEALLDERDKLLSITEEIDTRLEYFAELEHATRMLNHPGDSLVLQTDFLYMVERVDICIDYLKNHRHFKEAEIYLLRYQQCMTRAMTLIKMYFVGSLRALSTDIARRLAENDVSTTAQSHLLYTRFQSVAVQMAPLLGELERRVEAHPDDLSALLSECHSAYFSTRKGLLVSRLTEEIRGLGPQETELVELTRAGCSYLKQLCIDEYNLCRVFFHSGETQLYEYLEKLCDYLYDDLRPRILHEPRLSALCDVCTVLQALMILDVAPPDSSSTEDEEDDDEEAIENATEKAGGLRISQLLEMVLQDAQTRLFFKAQAVVQSDIRYYVPKPEDLAYPEKLIEARRPTGTSISLREKEVISDILKIPSLDKKDTWYPTLERVVNVLSQLHDFVKPAIFEDIAQEAISFCRQSLTAAAQMIRARASTLDGHLFLVRHLMILKEIVGKLELGEADADKFEFGSAGVTDRLASVLNKTTALIPYGLLAGLSRGGPSSAASSLTHNGIDDELRQACEDAILECTFSLCDPLHNWIERIQGINIKDDAQGQSEILSLDNGFRTGCQRDLQGAVLKLRLYLEDERTVDVLVGHVRSRLEDQYTSFRTVVGGKGISGHNSLMSSTELQNFMTELCGAR